MPAVRDPGRPYTAGMVQSVELLLDEDLNEWIWAQWRALADAGLPSQVKHGSLTNWPHITLGVADHIPAEWEQRLAEAVASLPIPIHLGGVVWFPGRRHVLARAVVPSAGLLRVQGLVSEVLKDAEGTGRRMTPGQWTPHVTLARGVRPEQLGQCVQTLAEVPGMSEEVSGVLPVARRWDSDAKITWNL